MEGQPEQPLHDGKAPIEGLPHCGDRLPERARLDGAQRVEVDDEQEEDDERGQDGP